MTTHKVYVASSWRNTRQPDIVSLLRTNGHEVYDFHNPSPNDAGFEWDKLDSAEDQNALLHPTAERYFGLDMEALKQADVVVLLMPSGRSAHIEAAWHKGRGGIVIVHGIDNHDEPELMYKMFNMITTTDSMLVAWMRMPLKILETGSLTNVEF